MNLDIAEDRSAAAGEYVLGTLEADAREVFARALADDRALQAEVYAWQDRLVGLAGRVAAAEPDPDWWPAIEVRLERPSAGWRDPRPALVRETGTRTDSLWQRLRLWQAVSGLALTASLVLATLLVLLAPGQTPAARYVAVLQSPDKSAGWLVEVSVGGRLRLVPIGPAEPVPPGKALQFWTKAQSASAPTSLGLIRPGRVTELPAADLPTLEAQQLFELTLEPETGSPIGRPTGPVLFLGRTVQI